MIVQKFFKVNGAYAFENKRMIQSQKQNMEKMDYLCYINNGRPFGLKKYSIF